LKPGELWHDDVLKYSAFDVVNNEFIGDIYLDIFARPGKFGYVKKKQT